MSNKQNRQVAVIIGAAIGILLLFWWLTKRH